MAIILILVIVISIFFVFGFKMFKKYWKLKKYSKNFNKVKGICTKNEKYYYQGVGVMDEDRGMRSNPYIEYTVLNRKYEIASKISYGGIAAFILKKRKFTVFYNPQNPYDAVLKNEISFYFQMFSFCIFIILILLYLLLNIVFNNTYKNYQYSVYCTIENKEFKMTNKVIAKTDKEALNRFAKEGITKNTCKNMRLERSIE